MSTTAPVTRRLRLADESFVPRTGWADERGRLVAGSILFRPSLSLCGSSLYAIGRDSSNLGWFLLARRAGGPSRQERHGESPHRARARPRHPLPGKLRKAVLILNLSRLGLDQLDQVIDDALCPSAGDAVGRQIYTICVPLPPPVKPTSVSRASPGPLTTQPITENRERRRDMRQPLLQDLDGADDVKLLARTGRAGRPLSRHGGAAPRP